MIAQLIEKEFYSLLKKITIRGIDLNGEKKNLNYLNIKKDHRTNYFK